MGKLQQSLKPCGDFDLFLTTVYIYFHVGFDVAGVFMRNWDLRDEIGHCESDEDSEYAMKVCKILNIPFYEVGNVMRCG